MLRGVPVVVTPTEATPKLQRVHHGVRRIGDSQPWIVTRDRERDANERDIVDVRSRFAYGVGGLVATLVVSNGGAAMAARDGFGETTTTRAKEELVSKRESAVYSEVRWKALIGDVSRSALPPSSIKAPKVEAETNDGVESALGGTARDRREAYAAERAAKKRAAIKARDEAQMAAVEARRAQQKAIFAAREKQAAEELETFREQQRVRRQRVEALNAASSSQKNKSSTLAKSSSAIKAKQSSSVAARKKSVSSKKPTTSAKAYRLPAKRKAQAPKKKYATGPIDRYSLRNTRKQQGGAGFAVPGFVALVAVTYYLLLQEEDD
jgi:hypothetical protein